MLTPTPCCIEGRVLGILKAIYCLLRHIKIANLIFAKLTKCAFLWRTRKMILDPARILMISLFLPTCRSAQSCSDARLWSH